VCRKKPVTQQCPVEVRERVPVQTDAESALCGVVLVPCYVIQPISVSYCVGGTWISDSGTLVCNIA
jgi:hypothetical protein